VPRPRTSKPRSPRHAALGQAIELVIAEDPHMTQESVAEEAGLTAKQVGNYIRGQGNPTYTTLVKLCEGLHVRPGVLMARADALLDKRLAR